MNVHEREIPGLYVLESPVWGDERGFFREWFQGPDLEAGGVAFRARQANLSVSARNVVRGLHYSLADVGQAKVVTCVDGELDDVIVDVRVGSPTFARVEIVHLSAREGRSVHLPAGVAHGFCVTSERAALAYLLSSVFDASKELEIHPFDPELAVAWALTGATTLSEKDAAAPSLAERRAADQLPYYVPDPPRR